MKILGIIGVLLSVWGQIHGFILLAMCRLGLLGDFVEGAALSMTFISLFLLAISIVLLSTQKREKKKISGLEPIKESKEKWEF